MVIWSLWQLENLGKIHARKYMFNFSVISLSADGLAPLGLLQRQWLLGHIVPIYIEGLAQDCSNSNANAKLIYTWLVLTWFIQESNVIAAHTQKTGHLWFLTVNVGWPQRSLTYLCLFSKTSPVSSYRFHCICPARHHWVNLNSTSFVRFVTKICLHKRKTHNGIWSWSSLCLQMSWCLTVLNHLQMQCWLESLRWFFKFLFYSFMWCSSDENF